MLLALQAGVPYTLAQTTAYALPPHVVFLQSTVAVELSPDGTTFAAVTASTTGTTTSAIQVRCTTSTTCTVIVKRFD